MLDSAAALYARHGYLGASISDLAAASGVSKSLLYHYFGSKEDILFEIMIDHVEASNRHKVLVNDLDNLPVDRRRKVVRVERELIDIVSDVLAAIGPHYGTSRAERRASTMLYFGMINWTHTRS